MIKNKKQDSITERKIAWLLSCQPRVTVTSCYVYKVIRDLESIDHLCINPIRANRINRQMIYGFALGHVEGTS